MITETIKTFCVEYVFKPREARVFPRSVNRVTVQATDADEAVAKVKGKREKYDFKILQIREVSLGIDIEP